MKENMLKGLEKIEMREAFESFTKKENDKLEKSNNNYINTLKVGALMGLGSPLAMLAMKEMNHYTTESFLGLVGIGLTGVAVLAVGSLGHMIKSEQLKNINSDEKLSKMFLKKIDKEFKKQGIEEYKNFARKIKDSNSELIGTLRSVSNTFKKLDLEDLPMLMMDKNIIDKKRKFNPN